MHTYTEKIQNLAKDVLKQGKAEMVIGFKQGTIPMAANPFVAKNENDADNLIWSSTCGLNLANYLPGIKKCEGKIGIIAKGCDSRNIVTHIVENKIDREKLYIIGLPCTGMVDKKQIALLFDDEITQFSEEGNTLIVKSETKEEKINKQEYLRSNCKTCTHRNPVIYDELVSDLVEEQIIEDQFADVKKIEAMSSEEKWDFFDKLTEDCIRCYACRNACPLCYCPTCFVDESGPQWVGKGQNTDDIKTFHYLRAYHCAGRCTDCGACEEACPMDIKVRNFTRKLNKDSLELFNWEAGLDISQRPPLDTYQPDDPDDFIM
ncbi:MAG: 4Fe-4S dicluster domain-containing protein [Desulfobacteraceae bacterium]|nr:4Fe-4S dicluster domain-containing protein [Desulfobacteraceae bacterium]